MTDYAAHPQVPKDGPMNNIAPNCPNCGWPEPMCMCKAAVHRHDER